MSQPMQNQDDARRAAVNQLIARVLTVPREAVTPHIDLVYELGAESIDFLDLLFSLDPIVGARVLPERWTAWIRARLPDAQAGEGITPEIIHEFVMHCREHPDASGGDAGAVSAGIISTTRDAAATGYGAA